MTGKTIKCSNCGGNLDVPEGLNKIFCAFCGTQNLLTDVLEIPGLTLLCLKCNSKNKEENIYCDKCGLMLQYYCKFCSQLHSFDKKVCPKEGLKFNVNTTEDRNGNNALHKAVEIDNTNTIELLISLGADINAKNKDGLTPLDIKLNTDNVNVDMVKYLIAKGANINYKDNNGFTLLHSGVLRSDIDRVKLLISLEADINIENNNGLTPLHIALNSDNINIDMVKYLIEKEAIITNVINKDGIPILHWAVGSGNTDIVELLITKGIDVNLKDKDGCSPLHIGAMVGNLKIIELLISKGADVNSKNNIGFTPLKIASESENINTDIVTLLKKQIKPLFSSIALEEGNQKNEQLKTSWYKFW